MRADGADGKSGDACALRYNVSTFRPRRSGGSRGRLPRTSSMRLDCSTDIVIFGGGAVGLWLLNRLRREGYQTVLIESGAVGGRQTLASQGIIHGGMKYALGGRMTDAARAVADMPAQWRRCLAGDDPVDLSGVTVLSERFHMWAGAGLLAGLKARLAARAVAGGARAVPRDRRPAFFAGAGNRGTLFELPDFVIDAASLAGRLAGACADHLFLAAADAVSFQRERDGAVRAAVIEGPGGAMRIRAERMVFCAGSGNIDLAERADLAWAPTQLRPLLMVTVKKTALPALYVHCIGNDFSAAPALTVTTHAGPDGVPVWYLGGALAEADAGFERDDERQIAAARRALAAHFPWVDLDGAEWRCMDAWRAEFDEGGKRPDGAVILEDSGVYVLWPTKLALVPDLADRMVRELAGIPRKPAGESASAALRRRLPAPPMAAPPWNADGADGRGA